MKPARMIYDVEWDDQDVGDAEASVLNDTILDLDEHGRLSLRIVFEAVATVPTKLLMVALREVAARNGSDALKLLVDLAEIEVTETVFRPDNRE